MKKLKKKVLSVLFCISMLSGGSKFLGSDAFAINQDDYVLVLQLYSLSQRYDLIHHGRPEIMDEIQVIMNGFSNEISEAGANFGPGDGVTTRLWISDFVTAFDTAPDNESIKVAFMRAIQDIQNVYIRRNLPTPVTRIPSLDEIHNNVWFSDSDDGDQQRNVDVFGREILSYSPSLDSFEIYG